MQFVKNRAFRKGMTEGLLAPYFLIFGKRRAYSRGGGDLVTQSWAEVGREMQRSLAAARSDVETARAEQAKPRSRQKRSA